MRLIRVLFVSLILLSLLFVFQTKRKELREKKPVKTYCEQIDIESYFSSILVPVSIAGETRFFGIATAFSTMITPDLDSELNSKAIKDSIMAIDSHGDLQMIPITVIPELMIGETTFKDVNAGVINLTQEYEACNRKIDGFLGSNFFEGKIIQLDFRNQKLLLTNAMKSVDVKNHEASDLLYYSENQQKPIIRLRHLSRNSEEDVVFDTGLLNRYYSMKKDVFSSFLEADTVMGVQIIDTLDVSNYGDGIKENRKDSIVHRVELDSIEFMGLTITNCPGVTSDLKEYSLLGAPFLYLGIITLDYIDKKFYFNPYKNSPKDLSPQYGLHLTRKLNQMVVSSIKANSVAQENNIEKGYILTAVNSIDLDSVIPCELIKGDFWEAFNADTIDLSFLTPDNEIFEVRMYSRAATNPPI